MNPESETEGAAYSPPDPRGHRLWVRLTHWLIAIAVIVMLYSGFTILQAHPRLYWGQTGNCLTKPLLELPISPNYRYERVGIENPRPIFARPGSPIDANMPFLPYNKNGWARSLHFLAGWIVSLGLAAYLLFGLFSGHFRRDLLPSLRELNSRNLGRDVVAHLKLDLPADHNGPPYGTLQKLAYAVVIFVALPLMILTGMTMSPALSTNWPILLDIFGGTQSARTIHFFTFAFLGLFLIAHLVMIALTGPLRQLRGMIVGK